MGAKYDRLRLITIERQAVVTEPRMKGRQTIFEVSKIGGKSIGGGGNVELGIVSILLERYIELRAVAPAPWGTEGPCPLTLQKNGAQGGTMDRPLSQQIFVKY